MMIMMLMVMMMVMIMMMMMADDDDDDDDVNEMADGAQARRLSGGPAMHKDVTTSWSKGCCCCHCGLAVAVF